uniref:Peptidase S1 domain-containing protein n=1 Tax=Acrobeloides nanus TaxID=290746 RepID=A0A914EIZ0_9BILA
MNGKDVPEGKHPWAVAFVDDDKGNCKKGDDIAVMELDSPIDEKIATYICLSENGDSGGGLVGVHDLQYFLFGVLSFGTPCANLKNAPSQNATKIKKSQIFTRIASHLDEIKGLIKG